MHCDILEKWNYFMIKNRKQEVSSETQCFFLIMSVSKRCRENFLALPSSDVVFETSTTSA